jgi:hypothetical protein
VLDPSDPGIHPTTRTLHFTSTTPGIFNMSLCQEFNSKWEKLSRSWSSVEVQAVPMISALTENDSNLIYMEM